MEEQNEKPKPDKRSFFKNLKWYEHCAAGWPLILVFLGGAIGGACGGVAYGLNVTMFTSKLPTPLKYVFSFLIGIGSLLTYFILVGILVTLFPWLLRR